jgi:hypothetical protein
LGNVNGAFDFTEFTRLPAANGPRAYDAKVKSDERQKPPASAFVKASTTIKEQPSPKNFYAINPSCGGANGREPPEVVKSPIPSKVNNTANQPVNPKVVYTASELERDYFSKAKPRRNSGGINVGTSSSSTAEKRPVVPTPAAAVKNVVQERDKGRTETRSVERKNHNSDPSNGIQQLSLSSGSGQQVQKPNFELPEDNPLFKLFSSHQMTQPQQIQSPIKKQPAVGQGTGNGRPSVVSSK